LCRRNKSSNGDFSGVGECTKSSFPDALSLAVYRAAEKILNVSFGRWGASDARCLLDWTNIVALVPQNEPSIQLSVSTYAPVSSNQTGDFLKGLLYGPRVALSCLGADFGPLRRTHSAVCVCFCLNLTSNCGICGHSPLVLAFLSRGPMRSSRRRLVHSIGWTVFLLAKPFLTTYPKLRAQTFGGCKLRALVNTLTDRAGVRLHIQVRSADGKLAFNQAQIARYRFGARAFSPFRCKRTTSPWPGLRASPGHHLQRRCLPGPDSSGNYYHVCRRSITYRTFGP